MTRHPKCSGSACRRATVLLLILCIVVVVAIDVASAQVSFKLLDDFAEWMGTSGALGPIAFAATYAVVTVSFVPGVILTVCGGYVFAQAYGIAGACLSALCVLVGSSVGAVCALLLGRYALRKPAESVIRRFNVLLALDEVLAEHGWQVVTLLRLSPIVPYNAFNYIMGVTKVSVQDFALGSVGMVPGISSWTLIGTMIHDVKDALSQDFSVTPTQVVVVVLGVVATLACATLITWWTGRKLKAVVKAQRLAKEAALRAQTQSGGVESGPAASAADVELGTVGLPAAGQASATPTAGVGDVDLDLASRSAMGSI